MTQRNSLKYISLFSGAGGLDLGLHQAGFELLLAVEQCPNCVSTLIKNGYSSDKILNKKIEDCSSTEIKSYLKKNEHLDLLVGGPPCQPFSKSSFWLDRGAQRMKDPRANTLIEFMRVVKDLKPENVLIENVVGIKYKKKDEGYVYICNQFKKINRDIGTSYSLSVIKVNAVDYGIPQKRERVFIVANLNSKKFVMPDPTHGDRDDLEGKGRPGFLTVWDAIGDLENIEHLDLNITNKWGDLLPSIPEGMNYLWHTSRKGGMPLFGWRTRYWSFLLKLSKEKPSWTITANPGSANGPFHWGNRKLSIREMARIQTFPDEYNFEGNYLQVRMQIGNAVPPLLAELLGNEIRKQLMDGKKAKNLKLAIKMNQAISTVQVHSEVADKYLYLIGVHKEHPGTGKGPGAVIK